MASPVEAVLLLCDAAQADPFGKVHILGAGWSTAGSPTAPMAVVALLKIPWDRANQKLPLTLALLDSDGRQVALGEDDQPVLAGGDVEVGRPPGLAHGSPLDSAFVLNLPSMPLAPGRYEWRLTIAGTTTTTSFQVIGT